jgi:hypothetical protein
MRNIIAYLLTLIPFIAYVSLEIFESIYHLDMVQPYCSMVAIVKTA